jgi:hypothetical protein
MEFKRYFYTNYYVSKDGNVKSIINAKEKLLTPKNGIIEYYDNKKKIRLKVHRMVKICFDFKIDYVFLKVKHLDKNKNNNNFDNLQWI